MEKYKDYKETYNNFDKYEELWQLDIKRLFNVQCLIIKDIDYELNQGIYDKNYIYKNLQNVLIINTIIKKKINKHNEKN